MAAPVSAKYIGIGAMSGAIVGGGVGLLIARSSKPTAKSNPDSPHTGATTGGAPPFLSASNNAAAITTDDEMLEIFTRMAPLRADAPELYDEMASHAATLNVLRDTTHKNPTTVLKANRVAVEAKKRAWSFKQSLTAPNVHQFTDIESKLHGAIDDRVAQVIADTQHS